MYKKKDGNGKYYIKQGTQAQKDTHHMFSLICR